MRSAKKVKEFRSILCFSADGGNKRFGDRSVAMQGGDLGDIYIQKRKRIRLQVFCQSMRMEIPCHRIGVFSICLIWHF